VTNTTPPCGGGASCWIFFVNCKCFFKILDIFEKISKKKLNLFDIVVMEMINYADRVCE
jgi:hypothetical protein